MNGQMIVDNNNTPPRAPVQHNGRAPSRPPPQRIHRPILARRCLQGHFDVADRPQPIRRVVDNLPVDNGDYVNNNNGNNHARQLPSDSPVGPCPLAPNPKGRRRSAPPDSQQSEGDKKKKARRSLQYD